MPETCSYYVLKYVPHILSPAAVNIGVLLMGVNSAGAAYCASKFLDDWSAVLRLHPDADVATLQSICERIRQQLLLLPPSQFAAELGDTVSNNLQIEGPITCASPADEQNLQRIGDRYLGLVAHFTPSES